MYNRIRCYLRGRTSSSSSFGGRKRCQRVRDRNYPPRKMMMLLGERALVWFAAVSLALQRLRPRAVHCSALRALDPHLPKEGLHQIHSAHTIRRRTRRASSAIWARRRWPISCVSTAQSGKGERERIGPPRIAVRFRVFAGCDCVRDSGCV